MMRGLIMKVAIPFLFDLLRKWLFKESDKKRADKIFSTIISLEEVLVDEGWIKYPADKYELERLKNANLN